MNVLLIVTGSVGVELIHKMVSKVLSYPGMTIDCIKIVVTESAKKFPVNFDLGLGSAFQNSSIWDDEANFRRYRDDKLSRVEVPMIGHIYLSKWADLVLVCPATANTIGKVSHGIADNLATEIIMASIGMKKRVVFAPAMNTNMFFNPFVQENIEKLRSHKIQFLYPTVKSLACGDYGIGALADLDDIFKIAINKIKWMHPLDTQHNNRAVPIHPHPGSFGVVRKHDIHCGVDLYAPAGTKVFAVEDGVVVKCGIFTGPAVGSPWWNETSYVMVKGASGVVCYGEINIDHLIHEGVELKYGKSMIGDVDEVLPASKRRHDICGHSNSMLHLELYSDIIEPPEWLPGEKKPVQLKDPTIYLLSSGIGTITMEGK
jgi:3-polyprenyl-4-hydroxybenzoate decarboxylase